MSRRTRGFTVLELCTLMAIIGLTILVVLPWFSSMRRRSALRAAASQMRTIFHLNRSRAVARGMNTGMKFVELAGEWHFAVYEDGDGDGVRNDDIKKGIDRMLAAPRLVFPESRAVTVGLLAESIKDPDGDPLPPTKSPIAFGTSTICSFTPAGESTPGTIYLTDRGR
ncbi:MAG: Tfp pilus assembly protein FimT/FimU, partial [Thermoanaerobaculia bacterium]